MSTLAVARATLVKDLRMEWRSKDAINSMLFFALLVVVIFSFAFADTAGIAAVGDALGLSSGPSGASG